MAKGSIAKENLIKRFKAAVGVGDAFIGESNKKFYFWSEENGERVQVALALTVPKVPLAAESGDLNFDDESPAATAKVVPMEASEQETFDRLMKDLGLNADGTK